MTELTWYYPDDLAEVPALLEMSGVVPCGGNTLLLKTGLTRTTGLIDLAKLSLNTFHHDETGTLLGATLTFADVLDQLSRTDPDSILVKALGWAASTPLRNRITLGGSIASFPIWSDLVGPLLALDAKVELIGRTTGSFALSDYLASPDFRKATLITGVRIPAGDRQSYYYRAGRTVSDYSSFNLSLVWSFGEAAEITDCRVLVVGTRKKYKRLEQLEQKLIGLSTTELDGSALLEGIELPFSDSKLGSAAYTALVARCELNRALDQIGRGC